MIKRNNLKSILTAVEQYCTLKNIYISKYNNSIHCSAKWRKYKIDGFGKGFHLRISDHYRNDNRDMIHIIDIPNAKHLKIISKIKGVCYYTSTFSPSDYIHDVLSKAYLEYTKNYDNNRGKSL